MTMTRSAAPTQLLSHAGGRLAYDVQGEGPLVVGLPGMGDLRSTYRFLVPQLVTSGYRVATLDLRGHGESSTDFAAYDDVAAASDVVALIEHLGGPAVVMGSSMGAGAAVVAAADRPDLVSGLVLLGPFVRDVPMAPGLRLALRLALLRPWGPRFWRMWHRKLFPSRVPDDYADYQRELFTSLARPGAWHAFQRTTRTSHQPADDRLDAVTAPTLVVMGGADPDFPDAAAEAQLVSQRLRGELLLVPDVGHYPQAEAPDEVGDAVLQFLAERG